MYIEAHLGSTDLVDWIDEEEENDEDDDAVDFDTVSNGGLNKKVHHDKADWWSPVVDL